MEIVFTNNASNQSEMPFALVQGEPLTVIPQDLYIPPDGPGYLEPLQALATPIRTAEGGLEVK